MQLVFSSAGLGGWGRVEILRFNTNGRPLSYVDLSSEALEVEEERDPLHCRAQAQIIGRSGVSA